MYEDRFGLMPELFEIFGEELVLKFLDIFAGKTITLPNRDVLERRMRDVRIWMAVTAKATDPNETTAEVVKELSNEYGVTEKHVRLLYEKVKSYMDKFSIRVQSDGS